MSSTKSLQIDELAKNYSELASKLLALDASIVSVTLSSPIGEILSMKYASTAEALKPSREMLDRAGTLIAVTCSLVGDAGGLYGGTRYVSISFGKLTVAMIPGNSKEFIIALGIIPGAPIEEIYHKVRNLVRQ
jgi:hypothetical protein